MKKPTLIITAILLVLGASGVVYAFNKHGDRHMNPGEKVEFVTERVTRKLDLDDAQRHNFGTLADGVAQIMVEARDSRQQTIDEIGAMLMEPAFDQARALQLVQQKTRMVEEKAPQVIASLAIFLDSLDVSQKDKLREFVENHRRGHHGHHEGHGHALGDGQ